jgi:hypothetical protein
VCMSLLVMLPAAIWTLRSATFDHTSASLLILFILLSLLPSVFLAVLLLLLPLLILQQSFMSAELSHSFVQQGFSSAAKEQEVPTAASLYTALPSVTAT